MLSVNVTRKKCTDRLIRLFLFFLIFLLWLGCASGRTVIAETVSLYDSRAAKHFLDGTYHEMQNQSQMAVRSFLKAYEYDSSSVAILFALSKNYAALQRFEEAVRFINRAIKLDSRNEEAFMLDLQIGILQKDSAQIEGALQNLVNLEPHNLKYRLQLAEVYLIAEKYKKAVNQYEFVFINDPENLVALARAVEICLRLENQKSAIKLLNTGINKHPENADLWAILGRTYRLSEDVQKAKWAWKECLKKNPENTEALIGLAMVFQEEEKYNRSDVLYQKILQLTHENPTILNNYAYSLAVRAIHLEEAEILVLKALKSEPGNPAFLDTAGWIKYQQGELDRALQFIESSLEIQPDDLEVLRHKKEILRRIGVK